MEYDRHLVGCFCDFSMYQQSEVSLQDYKDEVQEAYNLLSEEHSRQIFCACLKHYVTKNVYDVLESQLESPYFDVGIQFSKGYSNFVDCGAYIGDSLTDLVRLKGCEVYIGFELDIKNFQQLVECIDRLDENLKPKEVILYPCATSDKNEYLSFNQDASESSSFVGNGANSVKVPAVRLDDALKRMKIDFIKMDIEGAEIAALKGAKNIITTQKPDLAICVYHKITDMWEIPILLKEMCNEYTFYLRTYTPGAAETVLYATTNK